MRLQQWAGLSLGGLWGAVKAEAFAASAPVNVLDSQAEQSRVEKVCTKSWQCDLKTSKEYADWLMFWQLNKCALPRWEPEGFYYRYS
jgi:hypothetical protein